MSSDSKFFVAVVAGAVVILGAIIFFSHGKSGGTADIDYSAGQKLGEDSAKVKIVEFGDFQCPACGAAEPELRKAVEANKDSVQLIFRHFPLPMHKNAEIAAIASEAGNNQGKFWEIHDLLYANQDEWSNVDNPKNIFISYAKRAGLDEKKFRDDLQSDSLKSIVAKDQDYGDQLGVDQTPTFYINNQKNPGVKSADEWQKIIDDAKK